MQGQVYFNTTPLQVTTYLADKDHYTPGRAIPPLAICLHDTVGTNSLDWLSRTPGSNCSANRLITREGKNIKLVEDHDTPWTNGPSQLYTRPGSKANQLSAYLTIEMEHKHDLDPSWPDAQVRMCAWQCVEWWGFHGFLPIVTHWMVQGNKQDPQGFPFPRFWNFVTNRLSECHAIIGA